jgi:hypothetical protein
MTDVIALIAVLVFIQVLITGILAIRMSTISSEEEWDQFGVFRFRKKRKQN